MRGRTILKIAAVAVVAVVVAAVAVVATIDPNQHKGLIVAKVKEATGRDLVIDGDLSMVLGLSPAVRVQGVRFANADWADSPDMVAVEAFEAQVALIPALFGDLQVKRLVLEGAVIILETDSAGRANWQFAEQGTGDAAQAPTDGQTAGSEPPTLPTLEEVRVETARLVVKDAGEVVTELALDRLTLSANSLTAPLQVAARGAYNAVAFDVAGQVGPLARLLADSGAAPWPVALKGTVGGVALALDGGIERPMSVQGVDVALTVEARSLDGLRPVVGDLPPLPPLTLKARVQGGGAAWTLADMAVTAGRSSANGTVGVDLGKARPAVSATLQIALLDLGELLPKAEGSAAGASPAGAPEAPRSDKVFPREPLPLDGLKAADATFAVEVARLVVPGGVAVEGLGARGTLTNGRLSLDPVQARLGEGTVAATVDADASSGRALTLKAQVRGQDVVLGRLFADMALSDLLTGAPTDLTADLTGSGSSVAGLLGSLDGTLQISVGEGKINQALIDWAGGDVVNQLSEALNPFAEKRQYADLVCAAVTLRSRRGVIEYDRAVAFETSRMSVVSSGSVDLGAERLDVVVRPYPKDGVGISAGQLAEMVRLQGTLAEPRVVADMEGIARTAASVAGALATGGVSVLAQGLMGRAAADPQPCRTALEGPSTAPVNAQQEPAATAQPAGTPGEVLDNLGTDLQRGLQGLFGR